MISVNQAKELVLRHSIKRQIISLALHEAVGFILAHDIFSDLDIPPFDQSAMDGYALKIADLDGEQQTVEVEGEVAAGSAITSLAAKKAMRIFTGAPIPIGADAVVMQEKVEIRGDSILIKDAELEKGNNIRPKGSQTKKGDLVAKTGTKLNPAILAFLAGLGISTIKVYKAPEIFLIITGRELQTPGKPLQGGQIYESNSVGLIAGLKQLHVNSVDKQIADDDESAITELIKQGLASSDIVILTGGVSVGDYDFVCRSAKNAGVETIFHKVKQRPGKPLYFGKQGEKLVFGLPGNPASVLTCFYEYVAPCIKKIMGQETVEEARKYKLALAYEKKQGLTYFLKGKIAGDEVQPLNAQESYQMGSYAIADCLIRLEEDRTNYKKDELVQVRRFDV